MTGVCGPQSVELVRLLGANKVIDYTVEDFTRGRQRYDAIIDCPHYANHALADLRRVLTPNGVLVPSSNTRNRWIGGFSRVAPARVLAPFGSQRTRAPEFVPNEPDLGALAQLVQAGQVTPVIAGTYLLVDVPAAMRRFQEGNTHGKIVISVSSADRRSNPASMHNSHARGLRSVRSVLDVQPRGPLRRIPAAVGLIGRRQEQRIWGKLKRLLESDGMNSPPGREP